MSYKVSTDLKSITLNQTDTVSSVLQNIAIILSTPEMSCPLYRDFGLKMNFIDKPVPVAQSMMVMAISDAISKFEPRATLLNVTFEVDERVPGKLIPTVEVEINE